MTTPSPALPLLAPGGRQPRTGGATRALEALDRVRVRKRRGDVVDAAHQPVLAQGLETGLGVQLFDRSVRPPALTLRDATLIEHVEQVIGAIGKLQSALRLGASAQLPLLRIAMLNSFAASFRPHVIKRLALTRSWKKPQDRLHHVDTGH